MNSLGYWAGGFVACSLWAWVWWVGPLWIRMGRGPAVPRIVLRSAVRGIWLVFLVNTLGALLGL